MSGLLAVENISESPEAFVRRSGRIIGQFDHRTQDSGNISWAVETDYGTFFVKTAGTLGPAPAGAPVPYLDHAGRVGLLRNAVELAQTCTHPALARLRNVIESPLGPALVYDYAPGDLVGTSSDRRSDPRSAYQRFAHLPTGQQLRHFDNIISVHQQLAEVGWVASDLYDGCMILDFGTNRLTLIDLDTYQHGPGTNTMGRMFGSTRFMAPEEFLLGATIDQRTTVYTLGRLIWHFATRLTERADQFCGPGAVRGVVHQATNTEPHDRYPTVAELASAWQDARMDDDENAAV
jgi:serine/threonine-protein kinase